MIKFTKLNLKVYTTIILCMEIYLYIWLGYINVDSIKFSYNVARNFIKI